MQPRGWCCMFSNLFVFFSELPALCSNIIGLTNPFRWTARLLWISIVIAWLGPGRYCHFLKICSVVLLAKFQKLEVSWSYFLICICSTESVFTNIHFNHHHLHGKFVARVWGIKYIPLPTVDKKSLTDFGYVVLRPCVPKVEYHKMRRKFRRNFPWTMSSSEGDPMISLRWTYPKILTPLWVGVTSSKCFPKRDSRRRRCTHLQHIFYETIWSIVWKELGYKSAGGMQCVSTFAFWGNWQRQKIRNEPLSNLKI